MRSELFALRVAAAHQFVQRGANGNLPADRCLVCSLHKDNKVHGTKFLVRQRDEGDSVMRHVAANNAWQLVIKKEGI